jgi:flagellar motor switch protein FliG
MRDMKSQLDTLPPLEKAAILVSALDRTSADQLLEQMPEAMAAQVRNVLMQLDDVDPDLQQAVLEDFFNAQKPKAIASQTKQTTSRNHETEINDVELELTVDENEEITLTESFDRHRDRSMKSFTMGESESAELFSFLNEAETSVLIREMEKEHPQTVAVVLAQLPPRRAAEILEKLSATLQIEAVRRMVDLDEMDSTVLTELAQGFAKQLAQHIGERRRRINGMSRVANILASSPKETEARIMQNLEQFRGSLAPNVNKVRQQQTSVRGFASDERKDSPPTIRFQQSTCHEASQDVPRFVELATLSDDALLHVLQHVPSEVVVLALAGAEASLVQRITRRLPKSQGEMLNRALSHLGPLRLDEIDVAQQELVRKALELRLLKVKSSSNRRLAAA